MTRPRIPPAPAALLFYAALAALVFVNVWVEPAHRWIGSDKDPRLFIWYLGWIPHQLAQLHNPLYTDWLAYPDGTNLMWNTSMLFPSVLLWPITAAFGPVVAYNAMVTAGVAFSAWFGFLAARRLLDRTLPSVLAGLVYGFSPGMMAQSLGHPHVMIALFPPIALLLGHEVLVRRRMHPAMAGGLAGLAAALQLLTGEELLATTLLIAGAGVLLLALMRRELVIAALPYAARCAGFAALVFVLVAAYPLAFQFLGPQRVSGTVQPPDVYVSDLLAFVVPNHVLLEPGAQAIDRFTGNTTEDDAYLGLPLLALFAASMAAGRGRPAVRWTGVLAVLVAVLSLGPHLHVVGQVTPIPLPWAAVARLPLMESALPSRLMVTACLLAGITIAALWAPRLQVTRPWRIAAGVTLGAGLLAIVPPLPSPSAEASAPAFFQPGGDVERVPEGAVVLVTPFSSHVSTTAMYWQAVAGYRFKMPEGDAFTPGPYLGPHPSAVQGALDTLDAGQPVLVTSGLRAAARADLKRFGVTAIVAGPSPGQAAIVDFLTQVEGSPPVEDGGVMVWWLGTTG